MDHREHPGRRYQEEDGRKATFRALSHRITHRSPLTGYVPDGSSDAISSPTTDGEHRGARSRRSLDCCPRSSSVRAESFGHVVLVDRSTQSSATIVGVSGEKALFANPRRRKRVRSHLALQKRRFQGSTALSVTALQEQFVLSSVSGLCGTMPS